VLVDLVVLISSLVVTLTVRAAIEIAASDQSMAEVRADYLDALAVGALILGSISVNVFSIRGFYRSTRSYGPRYKVRAIIEAVVLSHLIFGFFLLMFWETTIFPRSVLVLNAALTIVLLATVRLLLHRVGWVHGLVDRLDTAGATDVSIRRVLVVGGAGYIGSALLRKLLDRGYQVRLLDVLMFGDEPIRHLLDHPALELIRADFCEVNEVVRAMVDVDAVVHLGAIVGDPACDVDPRRTIDTNVLATRVLADVSQTAGVKRFVFASTCSVYGAKDGILDEESELSPVSLYARSKIACEELLREMAGSQLNPVVLRFGTIYGLSGRTRFDLVVNLLTAKALVEGEITVFGGDQWRPFVHVDDAASAVLASLEAPEGVADGRVYNVGSNEQNYTIDQIAALIRRKVPSARVVSMGSDGDRRDYRVDFSRIRAELGFEPAWTVERGIEQVIDALTSGRVTDYRDPRYSNVAALEHEAALDVRDATAPTAHMRYQVVLSELTSQWTVDLIGPGP
jgi:nucleoside-diphosphate-sugar epimerase